MTNMRIWGLTLVLLVGTLAPGPLPALDDSRPTVLITGSNRGIGLELARQYADAGWNVVATCRSPARADALNEIAERYDNLVVEALDVTNQAQIDQLAVKYDDQPIDVLLNNAGILGSVPDQAFGTIDAGVYRQVHAVNVLGPLALAEAFAKHVEASEQKKIVTMTSGLGSMTLANRSGRFYAYRTSKAAANMAMRALRADLRPKGIAVGLISPGMVDTDMLTASGYRGPSLTTAESAAGLIKVIDRLDIEDDGLVVNYDGEILPW